MEKNVLNTDLTGKVAVVTGASGTLCSIFAKALARAGAKVALLGRNMEKLKELADAIEAEGGVARGYTCNVMNKANCLQVAEDVLADLGPCDILVNGAGGNNARANTDKEYFEMGDLDTDTVTFFDLDESGVEMVFNLNFIGTLLPTQAFARQMVGREGCNILNISSMNAYLPLTKIPAYSGSKAAVTNSGTAAAAVFDFAIPKGDKGDTGPQGPAGKTPVKGADYFTATDKQELVDAVMAALPNGNGVGY